MNEITWLLAGIVLYVTVALLIVCWTERHDPPEDCPEP